MTKNTGVCACARQIIQMYRQYCYTEKHLRIDIKLQNTLSVKSVQIHLLLGTQDHISIRLTRKCVCVGGGECVITTTARGVLGYDDGCTFVTETNTSPSPWGLTWKIRQQIVGASQSVLAAISPTHSAISLRVCHFVRSLLSTLFTGNQCVH